MTCVLVTGATGAIGSALVPLLLSDPATRVRLLLRAEAAERLPQRLAELFAFWELGPADAGPAGQLEAFRGDVCLPLLGLDERTYQRLAGEVTHVIHAAGNVKLNQPLEEARTSAVTSAEHVVAFARACQRGGQFRKLDFVSTVGVGGRTHGLVPEAPLPEVRDFHNTYEAAKAEAEAYLLGEMRAGLPATIHRPSMVVGDSQTGKIIHFQVFYHLSELLCGRRTWGLVPETGNVKLDIIPVDYVARALQLASAEPQTAGRIFHLCSGPERALPLSELTAECRRLFAARGRAVPRLWKLRPGLLRALLPIAARLAPANLRRSVQGLPFFLAYLDEEQVFDNTNSRAFFAERGLDVPPVAAYLERLLDYYCSKKPVRTGSRPAAETA